MEMLDLKLDETEVGTVLNYLFRDVLQETAPFIDGGLCEIMSRVRNEDKVYYGEKFSLANPEESVASLRRISNELFKFEQFSKYPNLTKFAILNSTIPGANQFIDLVTLKEELYFNKKSWESLIDALISQKACHELDEEVQMTYEEFAEAIENQILSRTEVGKYLSTMTVLCDMIISVSDADFGTIYGSNLKEEIASYSEHFSFPNYPIEALTFTKLNEIEKYLPKKNLGVVYLLHFENGTTKIGASSDPMARMCQLTNGALVVGVNIKPKEIWISQFHYEYKSTEHDLHQLFKNEWLHNELFSLTPEEIIARISDSKMVTLYNVNIESYMGFVTNRNANKFVDDIEKMKFHEYKDLEP